jgi:hypothetical protein
MFVKPKSGLKVRDPETKGFLPEVGKNVPHSIYWNRRLRDGDVVEGTPGAASTQPATDAPAADAKEAR